jgi:type II secretory pathway pseudopilin PulG
MSRQRTGSEDGFTLVEALVAFTILAGAIILGLRIFADGMRAVSAVETRNNAVAVVRAELARLSLAPAISEGVHRDRQAGVGWQTTVRAVDGPDPASATASRPFRIEIKLVDEHGQPEEPPIIETIVLHRAPAP